VDYISFSAHSDFLQTSEFVDNLMPPYVVLVHGDANEMARLKASLLQKYENKNIQVFSPKNGQTVQLEFRAEKVAKVIGKAAAEHPSNGKIVSGLLIEKDFDHNIIDPSDLNNYTQLTTSTIVQKLLVPYSQGFDTVRETIQQMYENIEETIVVDKPALRVCESITVSYYNTEAVAIEWNSDPVCDMLADSIIALLYQSKKLHSSSKPKSNQEQQLIALNALLQKQFGEATYDLEEWRINIRVDGATAIFDMRARDVSSDDDLLRQRVQNFLSRAEGSLFPVSVTPFPSKTATKESNEN